MTRVWGKHLVVGVVAALFCFPAHADLRSWKGKEAMFRKLASGQHRGRSLAQLRARASLAIAQLLMARPGTHFDAKAFARLMGAIPPAVRAELLAEHGVPLVKRPRSHYGRVGYRVSPTGRDNALGMLWRQVMAPNTVRTTDGHLVWLSDSEIAALDQTPAMRGRGRWGLAWNSAQLVTWLHAYGLGVQQQQKINASFERALFEPGNKMVGWPIPGMPLVFIDTAKPDITAPIGAPAAQGRRIGPEPPAGGGAGGFANGPAGWLIDRKPHATEAGEPLHLTQAHAVERVRKAARRLAEKKTPPSQKIGPLDLTVTPGHQVPVEDRGNLFSWANVVAPEHSALWKKLTLGGAVTEPALFTLEQAARFGVMTDLADPIGGL